MGDSPKPQKTKREEEKRKTSRLITSDGRGRGKAKRKKNSRTKVNDLEKTVKKNKISEKMAEFKWNIWTLALLLLSAATVCSSQAEAGSPTDNGGRDFGRRSLPPPPSRNLVRDGSDGGSAAKEPQAPFWKRPERMQEVHVEAVNSRVSHSISKFLPPFPR